MANSTEILSHLLTSLPQASSDPINYHFLVPNIKGLDNFLATYRQHAQLPVPGGSLNAHDPIPTPGSSSEPEGGMTISIFTAATETFSQKNTNCSIAESLERFKPVFATAKEQNIAVRAYISVALGCPYEGPDVDPKRVADLAVDLLELGSEQISIGDTTGMGNARSTKTLLEALRSAGIEMQDIALHLHDTYGQALVNSVVGLEAGVRTFDASVAGLGGCPYSPGATGNVSTEEMVYLMESVGLSTGVDVGKLSETGDWISSVLGRANDSRVGKALLAKRRRREDEKNDRGGPL
jgi:hydroxymethylglutaryl-CoA lyase